MAVALVAAMGIPSAVMGMVTWFLKKRIDAKDKDQEERNQAQQKLMVLLVKSTRASIALGEATAHACSEATPTETWRRLWSMPQT